MALTACTGSTPQQHATIEELGKAVSAAVAAKKTAHITMEGKDESRASGVHRVGSADVAITVNSKEHRLVFVNDDAYARLPAALAAQAGKPWARIGPDHANVMYTVLGTPYGLLQDGKDLGVSLTALKENGLRLGPVTTTREGDAVLTRYSVVIAEEPDKGEETLSVVIDEDDLPREITTLPAGTLRYSAWGAPVDIEAPPADQVGTLPVCELTTCDGFDY
nr:hypothetical protein [Kibdelosporangium sp. MJ126-NF4]